MWGIVTWGRPFDGQFRSCLPSNTCQHIMHVEDLYGGMTRPDSGKLKFSEEFTLNFYPSSWMELHMVKS